MKVTQILFYNNENSITDNEIKTYLISLILRSLIIVEWMLILRLPKSNK